MLKRLRRIGLAFGVLAALLALAFAVMSTPWFQRMLEHRVVKTLEALTGGPVEVEHFRFRPLVLQVILRGLVLHGQQRPGESPFLNARTVVVRIRPLSIVRRALLLRSLDGDTVEIHFYTRPDGSTNLVETLTPTKGSHPVRELINLEIESLSLARTRITWNEASLPLEFDARNAAILLRHDASRGYLGSLSSSGVQIKSRQRSLPPVNVSAQFQFSGRGLDVSSITWQCAGVRGQGAFSLENWSTPQTQASFRAEGQIAEFANALQFRAVRAGTLKMDASIVTREGEFTAKGHLQARQISFQTPTVQLAAIDFSTEYSANSQRVEFPSLNVSALGGSLQGRMEASLQTSPLQFELRSRVRNLLLDSALRSFGSVPTALTRLRPESQVSGTVEASWDGQMENLRSRIDLELDPGTGAHAGTLPVGGVVRGVITCAPSFSLQIQQADLTTPHSRLSAQGTLNAPKVGLTLQASTSDFEEWRPAVKSWGGSATRSL